MTREEAITYLNVIWNRYKAEYEIERETLDAYHMAIEALNNSIQMSNIQQLEAENGFLKEMVKYYREQQTDLVRCKDCKHYEKHETWASCTYWSGNPYEQASVIDDDFCSYGERREPTIPMFKEAEEAYKEWTGEDICCKSFTADEWYRNNFKDGETE